LINLEEYNNHKINSYSADPIKWRNYQAATEDELLNPAAETITVQGTQVKLTHDKTAHEQAGIKLVEYEPGRITMDEVGRLLVRDHGALFRATDQELYKSLPADLQKILVLDEWHRRDFRQSRVVEATGPKVEEIHKTSQQSLKASGLSLADLAAAMQVQNERTTHQNQEAWENDHPAAMKHSSS
jgi:hypothetical protein